MDLLLIQYFGAGCLDLFIVVAIMWIGLLWYFNFVQVGVPKIPDEQKPAIGKVIAPALFYFRWAAAMVLSGLILAWINGYVHGAMIAGLDGSGKNTAICQVCG